MQVGNEGRFINDFRGIAAAHNTELKSIVRYQRNFLFVDNTQKCHCNEYVVEVRAKEEIPLGAELLLDYGQAYWDALKEQQEQE